MGLERSPYKPHHIPLFSLLKKSLSDPLQEESYPDCRVLTEEIGDADRGVRIEEGLRIARAYEERIKEFFERNPDLRILEISYEEMLANAQGTVEKLIAFLELQPTPAQLAEALSLVLVGEGLKKAKQKARVKGLALTPFFLWYNMKFFLRKFFLRKRT